MESKPTEPIRVLIVEDQEDDFHYISFLLGKSLRGTYKVDWARSYDEGMEAVRRCEHDVGLFDYALMGRTGVELMREAVTQGCEMPIILLTGHDSFDIDQEALAAGAADYLCKVGLNTTQLERAIRYSMRHAELLSTIRKSQQQFELFLRNVPCAVCIYDDQNVIFQNEQFRANFDPRSFLGEPGQLQRVSTGPFTDGKTHWLINSFSMVNAQGRRLNGLAAVEITDRIRAEEMLQRTTRILNGILASLPVAVSSIDETGAIMESRGRGLADIGLQEGELVGTNLFTVHPQAKAEINSALSGGSVNFISEIVHDGRRHYLESYYHFDETRGKGALGFSINVTRRVEAEAARSRQSQLLRAIMRNLPVIVGRLDTEGKVIEAEGDGLAKRGIQPRQLLNQAFTRLFPMSEEAVGEALRGGSGTFGLTGWQDDEDEEWYAELFVFFDEENGSGAIFYGRDITERRRLERTLLHISDAEQQRIGADLHDGLGQQLTGIACMTAALRDRLQATNPKESEQAAMISGLANDAVAQSRALARGLCPVQLEASSLLSALEDLSFQVQLLHGIKCTFTTSGPAPACDHDTAVHVYRITQEAINNAIRHGQAQEILISLEADGPHHRIVIKDDGVGFDASMQRSRPGVGLHLMNYRAGIIGGTFSITSEPGGGARAECTFSTSSPAYETATP